MSESKPKEPKVVPKDRLSRIITLKITPIRIDDFTFRLHYRFTVLFLLLGCILLASERLLGKPILCTDFSEKKEKKKPDTVLTPIESFCWIEGTFILPKGLSKRVGEEVIAPGVEKYIKGDEVITLSYYQWVGTVLLFQALCFYFPRWLWKNWESGRMNGIISDFNEICKKTKEVQKAKDKLIGYLMFHWGENNSYAFKHAFCEVLNLVNVIGQMFFVNAFLGDQFFKYGLDVLELLNNGPGAGVDPMAKVFPKVTKCNFSKFGTAGEVVNLDILCVMSLNIFNEKLFIFFWFWFYILLFFNFLAVFYRLAVIMWPCSRRLLATMHNLAETDKVETIVNSANYGDWFLIYQINENVDKIHYRDMLNQLALKLREKERHDDERAKTNA